MTNTSTAVNDAVRAIVDRMRARTGYRSCWSTASTGVPVFHSAELALFEEQTKTGLVIADVGDPTRTGEAGDTQQAMATLGTRRSREELASIHCRCWSYTGDVSDSTMQERWDEAHAIVDDVDDVVRDDPSLGLVPAYREVTAQFDAVTGVRPYAAQGLVCEVSFDIQVSARI